MTPPPEPSQTNEDELLNRRLSDFFSTRQGGAPPPPPGAPAPTSPSASPPPAARPPAAAPAQPAQPPPRSDRDGPPGGPDATQRILSGLASIDARLATVEATTSANDLGAFRTELYDWLDGYTSWVAQELGDLRQRVTYLQELLLRTAEPDTATRHRVSRFS